MKTPAAQLHIWTIYQGAADVAAPFCVREWKVVPDGLEPLADAIPADSLAEAQELIPAGLHRIPRSPLDDPVIVESWL